VVTFCLLIYTTKRSKTEYGSIGSIYCIFNRVTINLLIVN